MTNAFESLGIDRLSFEERMALVDQIWDSLAAEVEQKPLTESQKQEVNRRLAEHESNPSSAIPWEEVEARILARWKK